jgi:ribosomal protein S18 acetylase RimI-like enzyme
MLRTELIVDVQIAHGWSPGLIGEVVRAHAVYYAREWRFGAPFETKVAREMGAFVDRYSSARDRIFRAERDGALLGALTIDGSDPALSPGEAHLRWFIVMDEARGLGLGRRLMEAATSFLDETGYRTCYLTTFAGLDAARRLYEAAGFGLVREASSTTWGTTVLEQRFERSASR